MNYDVSKIMKIIFKLIIYILSLKFTKNQITDYETHCFIYTTSFHP